MNNKETIKSSTKNEFDHGGIHITGFIPSDITASSGNVGRSEYFKILDALRSQRAMTYIKSRVVTTASSECDIVIEMNSVDAKTEIDIDLNALAATYISESDFEIVAKARECLEEIMEARSRSFITQPSAETIANYTRKCNLLDRNFGANFDEGTSEWLQKLAPYAHSARSFFSMRAAALWQASDRLNALVHSTSDLRPCSYTALDWKSYRRAFEHTVHQCNAIRLTNRDDCLAWSGRSSTPVKSKKRSLKQLPANWRDKVIDALNDASKYRAQLTLMRFAGFRPRELEMGIKARLVEDQVELEIKGAKVRAFAGQEWRKLRLQKSSLPIWLIDELSNGQPHIYKAHSGAMRKYLSRLSEKLFPRKNKSSTKVGPLISAYLFRHALASDLCEDGWSEIAIASVLGHSVSETARQYGVRVRSRSQKTISVIIDPNHVETARKVRAQMKFNPVELGLRISEINTIHKS